jgi:hypothetical protein
MPSDKDLKGYADHLPPIYRDILAAFPSIEPGRKAGYGLAFQTLAMHFVNEDRKYAFAEVQEACHRLAERGFFEIRNGIFAHPTDLGERLIATVTDRPPAAHSGVPQLPALTW